MEVKELAGHLNSIPFWEECYKPIQQQFDALVMNKALQLQKLKAIDLFQLPHHEAMATQKRINSLQQQVMVMHGFKVWTEQMRDKYLDGTDAVSDAYMSTIENLQIENALLQRHIQQQAEMHVADIEQMESTIEILTQKLLNK